MKATQIKAIFCSIIVVLQFMLIGYKLKNMRCLFLKVKLVVLS